MAGFEGNWGGGAQLWWVEASPGDRLTIPVEMPEARTCELIGFFTRAPDYGIIRLLMNGRQVGSLVDGYSLRVEPGGPVSFGRVDMKKGRNEIVLELVGKDYRAAGYSNGYLVGIDGFAFSR